MGVLEEDGVHSRAEPHIEGKIVGKNNQSLLKRQIFMKESYKFEMKPASRGRGTPHGQAAFHCLCPERALGSWLHSVNRTVSWVLKQISLLVY